MGTLVWMNFQKLNEVRIADEGILNTMKKTRARRTTGTGQQRPNGRPAGSMMLSILSTRMGQEAAQVSKGKSKIEVGIFGIWDSERAMSLNCLM